MSKKKRPTGPMYPEMSISPSGGHDVECFPLMNERFAHIFVPGPSRGEGVKVGSQHAARTAGIAPAIANPDFVEGTDGWNATNHFTSVLPLIDAETMRLFERWGPKQYPDRRYATPPVVDRGFAHHLATTSGRPAAPEPFYVNTSRYSGPQGLSFDMRGMFADIEAAERAGRTIVYPV